MITIEKGVHQPPLFLLCLPTSITLITMPQPPEWLQPDKTALDETLDALNKKYGSDFVSKGSEADLAIKVISTGHLFVDALFGVAGIPRGRIIEYFGNESSGKTLALQSIVEAQRAGELGAFVDAEQTFNPDQAREQGSWAWTSIT